MRRFVKVEGAAWLVAALASVGSTGCELVARIDRSQIVDEAALVDASPLADALDDASGDAADAGTDAADDVTTDALDDTSLDGGDEADVSSDASDATVDASSDAPDETDAPADVVTDALDASDATVDTTSDAADASDAPADVSTDAPNDAPTDASDASDAADSGSDASDAADGASDASDAADAAPDVVVGCPVPTNVETLALPGLLYAKNGDVYAHGPLVADNEIALTNSPDVDESTPTWSRGGTRITFVARPSGAAAGGNVIVTWADGSHPVQLTSNAAGSTRDVHDPVFSPDGTSVYFGLFDGTLWTLARAPADGSAAPTTVFRLGSYVRAVRFSVDGQYLAFRAIATASQTELVQVLCATNPSYPIATFPISGTGDDLTFAPDSTSVVVSVGSTLLRYDVSSGGPIGALVDWTGGKVVGAVRFVTPFSASYTPDGAALFIDAIDDTGSPYLGRVDLATPTDVTVYLPIGGQPSYRP